MQGTGQSTAWQGGGIAECGSHEGAIMLFLCLRNPHTEKDQEDQTKYSHNLRAFRTLTQGISMSISNPFNPFMNQKDLLLIK
jgi:hypothetical protein